MNVRRRVNLIYPEREDISIIADGGIRYPGDIAKALAAGADAVMLGSLLAGTDEAAGDRIVEDGRTYKTFRGMASFEVQKEKRPDKTPRVEGVSAKVPYRGPVADTLDNLEAGIRSAFSYSGARTLADLRNNAEFLVVTNNTLRENHPHHPYRL
jgi:IMP dehydrogenase